MHFQSENTFSPSHIQQIAKTEKIHKSSDRKITLKIQCMIQKYFCPSQKRVQSNNLAYFVAHELSMRVFPRNPREENTTAAPATQVEHDVRFSLMFAWNVM